MLMMHILMHFGFEAIQTPTYPVNFNDLSCGFSRTVIAARKWCCLPALCQQNSCLCKPSAHMFSPFVSQMLRSIGGTCAKVNHRVVSWQEDAVAC